MGVGLIKPELTSHSYIDENDGYRRKTTYVLKYSGADLIVFLIFFIGITAYTIYFGLIEDGHNNDTGLALSVVILTLLAAILIYIFYKHSSMYDRRNNVTGLKDQFNYGIKITNMGSFEFYMLIFTIILIFTGVIIYGPVQYSEEHRETVEIFAGLNITLVVLTSLYTFYHYYRKSQRVYPLYTRPSAHGSGGVTIVNAPRNITDSGPGAASNNEPRRQPVYEPRPVYESVSGFPNRF